MRRQDPVELGLVDTRILAQTTMVGNGLPHHAIADLGDVAIWLRLSMGSFRFPSEQINVGIPSCQPVLTVCSLLRPAFRWFARFSPCD